MIKFKTTKEVAQELSWGKENWPGLKFGPESLNLLHKEVKELLEDPEDDVRQTAINFNKILPMTLAFNVLGNGITDYTTGRQQTKEEIQKSFAIMAEEVKELETAMKSQDKVEILDALADIIVVAIGIAAKEGLVSALGCAFALVSHNNLTKLKFDEGTQGFYVEVKNGKIQKPEGFQNVDLSILNTNDVLDLEEEINA